MTVRGVSACRPADHAAAQTDLAVIEHRALAGRDRPLGLVELQTEGARRVQVQPAGGIHLAVAGLGGVGARRRGGSGAPA